MKEVHYNQENYHLWQPFTQMQTFFDDFQVVIERGDESYLIDGHGKPYINMTSGLWNSPLGSGREDIINAIAEQLRQLTYAPIFRTSHEPAIKLSELIVSLLPNQLNRVFLTSNGSETVESGIKLARQYFHLQGSKKGKIISLESSYHGVSYGAMSASGFITDKEAFEPLCDGFLQIPPPYCYRCPFGLKYPNCGLRCATNLEEAIKQEGPDEVAMFLLEPVMGVAGVIIPPPEYMDIVSGICTKYDVLLMLDEISTGFGRSGKMFALEHFSVEPDIVALGKGISGGYFPLGAAVTTDAIWSKFLGVDNSTRFNHGCTYAGHPGGCAAGAKTIELLTQNDLVEMARVKGEDFLRSLQTLKDFSIVGDVRGIGMMFGIEFVKDPVSRAPLSEQEMHLIMKLSFEEGAFVYISGNCMVLMPPFTMEPDLLHEALNKLQAVCQTASRDLGTT